MSTLKAFGGHSGAQQPAVSIHICFAFTSYMTKCGVGKINELIYFIYKLQN